MEEELKSEEFPQSDIQMGNKVKTQHTHAVLRGAQTNVGKNNPALNRKFVTQHGKDDIKPTFKLKIDKSVFVHEQKGKIKSRYRVLETLGKGSYGEVKKIQHKATGEFRAMKIICKEDVSQ